MFPLYQLGKTNLNEWTLLLFPFIIILSTLVNIDIGNQSKYNESIPVYKVYLHLELSSPI